MSQNEELFRKALDCLNRQDAAGYRALQAPDVEYINPQGTYRGRDEATASFAPEWRAFPDGKHEVVRLVETATGIAAECHWTGTQDGPLATPMGELPPSGRQVALDYAIWVDAEAGLAKKVKVYVDLMAYATQLGLIPQPQQA